MVCGWWQMVSTKSMILIMHHHISQRWVCDLPLSVIAVSAPRIPWSTSKPNTAGPEGWLSQTGLLPCHYFVHSFGSPSTYTIWNRGERVRILRLVCIVCACYLHPESTCATCSQARGIGGTALTHMERNYGDAFPTGWVWAQASAESG